jgi:hypothetical protein
MFRKNLPYALQTLDEESREEMLKLEDDYFGRFAREDDDLGLDTNCEQVPQTSSQSLSTIFKKHQRVGRVRELKLYNDKKEEVSAVTVASVIIPTEEDTVFNSKLCWLNNTPAMSMATPTVVIPTLDFPELSATNNRIIMKMCPKVNNGFKCHNVNCNYQHPPVEETKKIVSDMRSLKKRVVKDVLKVMDTPTSAVKQTNGKSKLCKFQDKCKFKATCSFAHSTNEITVNPCQFGVRCKLIKNEGNTVVNNITMKKKCGFIHPKESKEMYLTRHK